MDKINSILEIFNNESHLWKTYKDIANLYNSRTNSKISSEAVRKIISRNKNKINCSRNNIEILMNSDGSLTKTKILNCSEKDLIDEEKLLLNHDFNPDEWCIKSAENRINQKGGIYSRITVKPKESQLTKSTIKEIYETLGENIKVDKIRENDSGKILEINISDFHFGKICFEEESGDFYNIKEAEKIFMILIYKIISRVSHTKIKKIYFIYSNDFFHIDNALYCTTKGTQQHTSSSWQEIYRNGCNLLVSAIDSLKEIAPVETFYVGANHDKMTAFHSILMLDAYYRKDKYVTVDISEKSRKFRQFGKCLVGWCHGNMQKDKLDTWLQVEAREEFGKSKYVEVHAGHCHHERVIENNNGIIVRHLPSVSGVGAWEYENGYIGSLRRTISFLWDEQNGLSDMIITNV